MFMPVEEIYKWYCLVHNISLVKRQFTGCVEEENVEHGWIKDILLENVILLIFIISMYIKQEYWYHVSDDIKPDINDF